MPEMDGFELINWLRSNKKYSKIPVLVMTGVEKEISKFTSLAISDSLAKPFYMFPLSLPFSLIFLCLCVLVAKKTSSKKKIL
ncbi:MAG: hypothetical protein V3U15_03275 [Nitrospinota bacterium]